MSLFLSWADRRRQNRTGRTDRGLPAPTLSTVQHGRVCGSAFAYRFTGAPPGYIGSDQPGLRQGCNPYGPRWSCYLTKFVWRIRKSGIRSWDFWIKGSFKTGPQGDGTISTIVRSSSCPRMRWKTALRTSADTRSERFVTCYPVIRDGVDSWDRISLSQSLCGTHGTYCSLPSLSPVALHAIVKDRLDAALAGVQQKSRIDAHVWRRCLGSVCRDTLTRNTGCVKSTASVYEKLSPALAAVLHQYTETRGTGRLSCATTCLPSSHEMKLPSEPYGRPC